MNEIPKQEESFGVIPLKLGSGGWEVFLIQHQKARYWGFPKGHPEPNETAKETALRELKEETNLEVTRFLQKEPLSEQYRFIIEGRKIHKKVYYFVAEVSGEVILQQKEIQDGIWVPFREAIKKVTHQEGKAILLQVEKILSAL
jgi:8-oxo-dGTP pyrophosphatase MutT (NUDIX family)